MSVDGVCVIGESPSVQKHGNGCVEGLSAMPGTSEGICAGIDVVCCSKEGMVRVFDLRKQFKGSDKPLSPVCSLQIGSVTMPRLSWMNNETIGITSLEGDFYKLTFTNGSLEVETTPFLKRID